MTTTYRIYLIINAPKKKKVFILNKHLELREKWPHEMHENSGRPSPIIATLPFTPATPELIAYGHWRLRTGDLNTNYLASIPHLPCV